MPEEAAYDPDWKRPWYRAADLPALMARDRHIPRAIRCFLVQLARDWHDWPERREWILEGTPDLAGDDPYDLAKVAALVRGLCDRDGYPVPSWTKGLRAPTEITMFTDTPIDDEWGKYVKRQAPNACYEHGVYYEADLLLPKAEALTRAARRMRSRGLRLA